MKCNDVIYQGYHTALEPCTRPTVVAQGTLPFTGVSLLVFFAVALALVLLGVILRKNGRH